MSETRLVFETEKERYDAILKIIQAEAGFRFSSVIEKVKISPARLNWIFWNLIADGTIEGEMSSQGIYLLKVTA
jgi:hypothetical protein